MARHLKQVSKPRLTDFSGQSAKRPPLVAVVGIVMGSTSDWDVMKHAAEVLREFDISFEARVVSAHRTPDLLFDYAKNAHLRGISCIIAGAGGAAHLPGMLAAITTVPVLGVPVPSHHLQGMDSLLSIVQMPRGVPVATFAIGVAGAANAGYFAVAMLGQRNDTTAKKLRQFRTAEARRISDAALPEVM